MTRTTGTAAAPAKVLINLSSPAAATHGGVARFGIELSRRLAARGKHRYTFRSQWAPSQLPSELVAGATIEQIPPIRNYFGNLLQTWIKASWSHPASRFDIVLNLDPLGFAMGGGRRITIVHDIYFRSIPRMFSAIQRLKQQFIHTIVFRRSHAIIGISEATSAEVRRHFPSVAARVNTVLSDSTMNDITAAALYTGLEAANYLLVVANVTPNKNCGVVAEAFARIAADLPGLRLVHVGGDARETFEKALAPRGLRDRLTRLNGIDDAALAGLYRHALCLVVPSLCEGFCLPLLEAQRLGCPTIFSDRSATGEVGGDGGIAFDPDSVDALSEVLRRVVSDPALRADMVARGHANARRFSWEATVDGYERSIQAVLDRNSDAQISSRN